MRRKPYIAHITAITFAILAAPVIAENLLDPQKEWDFHAAAHLLRRAGFGGTHEQVKLLEEMGLDLAVDYLIDFEKVEQSDPDYQSIDWPGRRELRDALPDLTDEQRQELRQKVRVLDQAQFEEFRAWWVRRMVRSARPLEEKMTLFWHGYFTSGAREVGSSELMIRQNRLFRDNALNEFASLLRAISHDPAMLKYLNAETNRKEHPNENFARELMELFTLGAGNYTEQDVKEAARAFTGWSVVEGEFRFRPAWHDGGSKFFLGRRGNFDGDKIVDILLLERATARWLAGKLIRFFVMDDPPEEFVNALAVRLRATDFDLRKTMRALLKSRLFYSDQARLAHIKSPIELAVSTVRTLDIKDADYWSLVNITRGMGQDLLQPPNVKGWDGGRTWITSATLFSRYEFAGALLKGLGDSAFERRQAKLDEIVALRDYIKSLNVGVRMPPIQVHPTAQGTYDVKRILGDRPAWPVDELIDHFALHVFQAPLSTSQRALLADQLTARETLRLGRQRDLRKAYELLYILMTLPEFQLG